MPGPEAPRQAAGERLLYAQRAARGVEPGMEAAQPHRWSGKPIPTGMSLGRSRGGLEVVPAGYGAARGGSGPGEPNPRETPAAFAIVRDGPVPRARLLWAAALLLEAIAADAPGDPDAAALALERDLALAEPDRVLFLALIRVALGLSGRRTGHGPAEAALASEVAALLGQVKRSAPPSADPPWPGEPLTQSETDRKSV